MAQIKKNERRYVALSYYEFESYTHKAIIMVVAVGAKGSNRETVETLGHNYVNQLGYSATIARVLWYNMFVVTESVCKRSYKRAWDNWMENSN